MPALARHFQVYLVDLPGFGSMHFPRSRFVLKRAGMYLVDWLKKIGISCATFIGHSMGGYICIWLAAHHPEMVDRLVLAAPAVMPKMQNVFEYFVPLLTGARYMSPHFFPILFYDALRAGPLTLLRAARDLLTQDVHEELQRIAVATLLIWGDKDTLVPPSLGPVLTEQIHGSHLLYLRGAGHVCMFDCSDEFNEATLRFLCGEAAVD